MSRARGPASLIALLLAALTACPARQRAPSRPPATAPTAQPPGRARLIVAVAELAGDRDHLVKRRVLAHLRAFASGPGDTEAGDTTTGAAAGAASNPGLTEPEIEVLDLPRAVLAPEAGDALSPLDVLQEGHGRARELLAETGAGALIWGTAGAAGAPVLYVTTAESSRWPCSRDPARLSGDAPAGHVLCALDTGATWLLCATAWSRIVPVGCAAAP